MNYGGTCSRTVFVIGSELSYLISNLGGTCSRTVFVIGSELSYLISNLNKAVCISHCTNIIGKAMNPTVFLNLN